MDGTSDGGGGEDVDAPAEAGSAWWGVGRPTSVRMALLIGFTLVSGLWLLTSYQLVNSFRDVDRVLADAQASHARSAQILSEIRTKVLLGSIFLRDAFIEGRPGRGEPYPDELMRLRREIGGLLAAYTPEVSPADKATWDTLQKELDVYWASREGAFAGGTESDVTALLSRRVVPGRETVIEILDQVAALQSASEERQRAGARLPYVEARQRLLWVLGGTLLLAVLVGAVASRHVQRLQARIERQRQVEQRSREELQRLSAGLVTVQERERRSLSRELHDEVGQGLTALRMDIGIALRAANLDPRARTALVEARAISESTLRSVRDMSQLLHPSVLDDFGLPVALGTYLRSFSQRTGIRSEFVDRTQTRLPSPVELCVYRIVQESLNNLAQHSGASACTVTLAVSDGRLRLVVEDDGRGIGQMPNRHPPGRGLGLIGMRERAQALGGTFDVSQRAGGGTSVTVTLPFGAADAVDGSPHTTVRQAG